MFSLHNEYHIKIINPSFKFACLASGLFPQLPRFRSLDIVIPEYQEMFPRQEQPSVTHEIEFKHGYLARSDFDIPYNSFGLYLLEITKILGLERPLVKGRIPCPPISQKPVDLPYILVVGDYQNIGQAYCEGYYQEQISEGDVGFVLTVPHDDPDKIALVLDKNCKAVISHASEDALYALLAEYDRYPKAGSYKACITVNDSKVNPMEAFYWPIVCNVDSQISSEIITQIGANWALREKFGHVFYKYIQSLKNNKKT